MKIKNDVLCNNKRVLINSINLEFKKGNIYTFLGSNGTGKTELLKLIYAKHLLQIEEFGTTKTIFSYADQEVADNSLLVVEYIKQYLDDGVSNWYDKAEQLMKKWKMDTNILKTPIIKISNGELRFIELIVKLENNPDLILIDEPESNLNKINLDKLLKYLKQIKKDVIIIISTHNTNVINFLSDYIYLIKDKKISLIKKKNISYKELLKLVSGKDWVINENFKF